MRTKILDAPVANAIWRSTQILDRTDRQKIGIVVIIQISLGFLDLAGIAIVGVIGALSIAGFQGQNNGDRVATILSFLNLETFTLQSQVAILGGIAASLLILKTILSILFIRRIMFFLSRRGAIVTSNLMSKILSMNFLQLQKKTNQELLYYATVGVPSITLGIIGTTITLIADISLLIVLTVGLFALDPIVAVFTILTFTMVGLLMYKLLHRKATILGEISSKLSISSNEKILEVLTSYRESIVRNRRSYYLSEIRRQRIALADTLAELTFMPNISKYVVEVTVVLGVFCVGAIQFMLQDATRAVAVLTVFLAASTRIAPAALRVQQSALRIRGNLGAAGSTLDLLEELEFNDIESAQIKALSREHLGFVPNVFLENVTFKYLDNSSFDLNQINLKIEAGESIAIVGPTGSGKTTLVDLILGILQPHSGEVRISGLAPDLAISRWPGAISYVPQDVLITNGSIRENVSLGYPPQEAKDEFIWESLNIARLDDEIKDLINDLDSEVGDRGAKLSGGQRQRLGIARAMFTAPNLLVLDEATSALDGQTEAELAGALHRLRGKVTVLMIAHRLSSVRMVDRVVYMESGRVVASGTFEEVREKVPNFDIQAQLMGL